MKKHLCAIKKTLHLYSIFCIIFFVTMTKIFPKATTENNLPLEVKILLQRNIDSKISEEMIKRLETFSFNHPSVDVHLIYKLCIYKYLANHLFKEEFSIHTQIENLSIHLNQYNTKFSSHLEQLSEQSKFIFGKLYLDLVLVAKGNTLEKKHSRYLMTGLNFFNNTSIPEINSFSDNAAVQIIKSIVEKINIINTLVYREKISNTPTTSNTDDQTSILNTESLARKKNALNLIKSLDKTSLQEKKKEEIIWTPR